MRVKDFICTLATCKCCTVCHRSPRDVKVLYTGWKAAAGKEKDTDEGNLTKTPCQPHNKKRQDPKDTRESSDKRHSAKKKKKGHSEDRNSSRDKTAGAGKERRSKDKRKSTTLDKHHQSATDKGLKPDPDQPTIHSGTKDPSTPRNQSRKQRDSKKSRKYKDSEKSRKHKDSAKPRKSTHSKRRKRTHSKRRKRTDSKRRKNTDSKRRRSRPTDSKPRMRYAYCTYCNHIKQNSKKPKESYTHRKERKGSSKEAKDSKAKDKPRKDSSRRPRKDSGQTKSPKKPRKDSNKRMKPSGKLETTISNDDVGETQTAGASDVLWTIKE